MQKKFRSLALVMIVAVLLIVTACGSGNNTENAGTAEPPKENTDAAKPAEDAKLRVTWHGSQARHDATLAAMDVYSTKYPNIEFEPEYMAPDTYFTTLAANAAAKNLPDIIQIDTANIMDYALRGQFTDLAGGINVEDVDSGLIESGSLDGKLYGIPIGATALGLVIDKTALEDLGVTIPEKGFSWDEWIQLARDLKPKLGDGKYVIDDFSISSGLQESDKYEMYQLSKGKGFVNTPEGTFNIDRDTYIEFINLFAELRKEGIVPPADVSVAHKEFDPKLSNVLNGTMMMGRNYASSFSAYYNIQPGRYDVMVAPYGENSGSIIMPAQYFAVSETSENKEESKKFIDWFINDVEAGKALGLSRGPIVSKKVADALLPSMNEAEKAQINMVNQSMQGATPFPGRPKGFGPWTEEYMKISQATGFEKMTPEQAYDELKKKWDEIIAK